jgi:predicted ATP-binding protein involved in virulence/SAM-dependent methyltransferase
MTAGLTIAEFWTSLPLIVRGGPDGLQRLGWLVLLKIIDTRRPTLLPEALRWSRWASRGGLPGGALTRFVEDTLLPGLSAIEGDDPMSVAVRDVFTDFRKEAYPPVVHRDIVEAIDAFDLSLCPGVGDLVDLVPGALSPALADFVVGLLDPRPGEAILDLACGTGEILTRIVEHLRRNAGGAGGTRVGGFEASRMLLALCMMDLLLHEAEIPVLVRRSPHTSWSNHEGERADVIVALRPVAISLDDRARVQPFLGALPDPFRSADWVGLSIHLAMNRLRPGGRAVLAVGDEFLGGGGTRRLREWLLEECNLHTLVRLERERLLFFTKGEPTREVWFYDAGQLAGLEETAAWWSDRRETDRAYRVSLREIQMQDHRLNMRRLDAARNPAPARVLSLELRRFRGFEKLKLTLPPHGPAVFLGANGAGKSSVIECLAMLLSSFTIALTDESSSERFPTVVEDIKEGAPSASLGATFSASGEKLDWEILVRRTPRSVETSANIGSQTNAVRDYLQRFERASLPVLAYYSAARGLGEERRSFAHPSALPQTDSYLGAFSRGLGPFADFISWFRLEEGHENQVRLRRDPAFRNPRLEVVRRALQIFLSTLGAARYEGMHIERDEDDKEGILVVEKDGVPLRIDQLSEGEKNTLLLVADLARRFAVANPALGDPLQGEGIVLIDEVDLHLHPAWQRAVLPAFAATFPHAQIIATTHSPQVLSLVPHQNVFILKDFELAKGTPHTYGRDSNAILAEVMDTPERPPETEERVRRISDLIDREEVGEAKAALQELASIIGERDAEVTRLQTLLHFLHD